MRLPGNSMAVLLEFMNLEMMQPTPLEGFRHNSIRCCLDPDPLGLHGAALIDSIRKILA
jgi:hypothetical protein